MGVTFVDVATDDTVAAITRVVEDDLDDTDPENDDAHAEIDGEVGEDGEL